MPRLCRDGPLSARGGLRLWMETASGCEPVTASGAAGASAAYVLQVIRSQLAAGAEAAAVFVAAPLESEDPDDEESDEVDSDEEDEDDESDDEDESDDPGVLVLVVERESVA